jgi:hypothetical protein
MGCGLNGHRVNRCIIQRQTPHEGQRQGRSLGLGLIVLGALWSASGSADPVLEQIEAAGRAYERGEPAVAIEAMNVAIAQIRQQQTDEQLKLFPDPLPGWSATDASAQSGGIAAALTGKLLTRTYDNAETGAKVVITLSANSPFTGFISGIMQMPLLQGGGGLGTYVHQGYRGLLEPGENGSAKPSLILNNSILLQLDGSRGADAQVLEAYVEAFDLPRVEKAFDP